MIEPRWIAAIRASGCAHTERRHDQFSVDGMRTVFAWKRGCRGSRAEFAGARAERGALIRTGGMVGVTLATLSDRGCAHAVM
ncbi:hypothetical protein OV142_27050 [Nannocystis sp. SCPEA4]|nr:hypothetical protein [Nannocystis sp. SCPEA4]